MSATEKQMTIVTTVWNSPVHPKTFRLIPLPGDRTKLIYSEIVYDPDHKTLAMITTMSKPAYHMVARLNDDGDTIAAKHRQNKKTYKEQRVELDTYVEFYISEKDEILKMINLLADNADTFDFAQYMTDRTVISKVAKPEPATT